MIPSNARSTSATPGSLSTTQNTRPGSARLEKKQPAISRRAGRSLPLRTNRASAKPAIGPKSGSTRQGDHAPPRPAAGNRARSRTARNQPPQRPADCTAGPSQGRRPSVTCRPSSAQPRPRSARVKTTPQKLARSQKIGDPLMPIFRLIRLVISLFWLAFFATRATRRHRR